MTVSKRRTFRNLMLATTLLASPMMLASPIPASAQAEIGNLGPDRAADLAVLTPSRRFPSSDISGRPAIGGVRSRAATTGCPACGSSAGGRQLWTPPYWGSATTAILPRLLGTARWLLRRRQLRIWLCRHWIRGRASARQQLPVQPDRQQFRPGQSRQRLRAARGGREPHEGQLRRRRAWPEDQTGCRRGRGRARAACPGDRGADKAHCRGRSGASSRGKPQQGTPGDRRHVARRPISRARASSARSLPLPVSARQRAPPRRTRQPPVRPRSRTARQQPPVRPRSRTARQQPPAGPGREAGRGDGQRRQGGALTFTMPYYPLSRVEASVSLRTAGRKEAWCGEDTDSDGHLFVLRLWMLLVVIVVGSCSAAPRKSRASARPAPRRGTEAIIQARKRRTASVSTCTPSPLLIATCRSKVARATSAENRRGRQGLASTTAVDRQGSIIDLSSAAASASASVRRRDHGAGRRLRVDQSP